MGFSVREANDMFHGLDDFILRVTAEHLLTPMPRTQRSCSNSARAIHACVCSTCVRLHYRLGMNHPAQCGT